MIYFHSRQRKQTHKTAKLIPIKRLSLAALVQSHEYNFRCLIEKFTHVFSVKAHTKVSNMTGKLCTENFPKNRESSYIPDFTSPLVYLFQFRAYTVTARLYFGYHITFSWPTQVESKTQKVECTLFYSFSFLHFRKWNQFGFIFIRSKIKFCRAFYQCHFEALRIPMIPTAYNRIICIAKQFNSSMTVFLHNSLKP